MNITVKCNECNKEFQINQYRYNRRIKVNSGRKIYCSVKCSKAEKSRLSNIEVQCAICNKTFYRKKSRVYFNSLRGSVNICSNKCQLENARRVNTKYDEKSKKVNCEYCGKNKIISIYNYNRNLKQHGGKFYCSSFCIGKQSPSEEVIQKIRSSQLNVPVKSRGRKGHIVTEETKEKLRESYHKYERNPPNLKLVHDCMRYLGVEKYHTTIGIIPDAFYSENGKWVAIESQRGMWPSCVGRKIKAYDNLEHNFDEIHIFWLDSKNNDKIAGHWYKSNGSWQTLI
jgi:hypothetical protein